MKALLTSITAVMLLTAIAPAEDKPPGPPQGGRGGKPNPEDIFKKLDSNSDGSISLDEFKAGPRAPKEGDKAQEIFGKIDKDGNGSISLDEFKEHRPPHGPGGPGGKGKGENGGGPGGPGGQGGPGGPGGGGPKGPPKGGQ